MFEEKKIKIHAWVIPNSELPPYISGIPDRIYLPIRYALKNDRILKITYENRDKPFTRRRIAPEWLFISANDEVYVSAFCLLRNEQRTFRLDRISSAKLTGASSKPYKTSQINIGPQPSFCKISLKINGTVFDNMRIPVDLFDEYTRLELFWEPSVKEPVYIQGLENKSHLEDNEGMAYVITSTHAGGFVNINTELEFDLIMVNRENVVTAVHTMAKADPSWKNIDGERREYRSPTPSLFAFVLKAGMAQKLGAEVGKNIDILRLFPEGDFCNIIRYFKTEAEEKNGEKPERTTVCERDWRTLFFAAVIVVLFFAILIILAYL